MAVDPYGMCPCGSGKKLKFCCSDLVGEIEKIHRMIEGEQPRAALRHVEHTLASHPGRASLLDLKATLEMSLGEIDAARATIAAFVASSPDSATAHAGQAIVLAESDQPLPAGEALQRALGLVERAMPLRVYEALGSVGGAMLKAGHILSAQAHLWLYAAVSPLEDSRAREVLVALNHYSGLPLILRDQLRFHPWPAEASWKEEAAAASQLAERGKWQQAVTVIDRLGARFGADPALVYNRALLAGWLGDDRTLVAGLHAFAQMDVPLDDAVEAEAVAQLLDPELKEPRIETVDRVYAINDLDALAARLASDRHLQAVPADPAAFAEKDQPRPRHTYVLLDRLMPESGVNITREQMPRLAAAVAVYGRQTDRAERLEVTINRGPEFESTLRLLEEIAGGALGNVVEEQVVGAVPRSDLALHWRWHPPRDTPRELLKQLNDQERHAAIVERWSTLPQLALQEKSPLEATRDPMLRIPLLASVLRVEYGNNTERDARAVADLRRKLGLSDPVEIDAAGEIVSALPLVRVSRLNLSSVSDDDLVQLYRRSNLIGAASCVSRLAREAVGRPTVADRIKPEDAFHRMIMAESDPQKALAIVDEARQHTPGEEGTAATWDLMELELHISAGNLPEAQRLLSHLEREYHDDPGVMASLYQLLYEVGAIPDDVGGHRHAHEPALAGATAAEAPPASPIWTPDSERPAGGKSALWTPS